jgi:hypothetical protein
VTDRLELRASDADRERAAELLREACAVGRLSVSELSERLDAAYAARTRRDLERTLADLPRGGRRSAAPVKRPLLPGSRPFTERFAVSALRSAVLDHVYTLLAPVLHECGYDIASRDERAVVFEREERPPWTIAAAVLVFPLGLFALAHRRRRRVVLTFADAGGGTQITVYGNAPLAVRRAFAELGD